MDELTATMQAVHISLQNEISELRKEVADCRKEVARLGERMPAQSERPGLPGVSTAGIPSLRYPQPLPVQQNTFAFPESGAPAAPSPISATSNISSSSSSFHLSSLALDSPQTRVTGLPVAGPSGVSGVTQERSQVPGMSSELHSVPTC